VVEATTPGLGASELDTVRREVWQLQARVSCLESDRDARAAGERQRLELEARETAQKNGYRGMAGGQWIK